MPRMKRCADRMCRALIAPNQQYCNKHQQQTQRSNQQLTTQQQLRQRGTNQAYNQYDRERDSFYQSTQWKALRQLIVARDYNTCAVCNDTVSNEKIVDHIVPLRVNESKGLQADNLMILCRACHNKKSMLEGQLINSPNGINKVKHASKQWYIRTIRQLNNKQ